MTKLTGYLPQHTELDPIDNKDNIQCIFESPRENIIWLLTEELKYAHIKIIGGREEKIDQWQNKYSESLRRKNLIRNGYAADLEEVTVSRVAVRTLKKIIGSEDPQRGKYFEQLYRQSLVQNRHIVPNIRKVVETTYFD